MEATLFSYNERGQLNHVYIGGESMKTLKLTGSQGLNIVTFSVCLVWYYPELAFKPA